MTASLSTSLLAHVREAGNKRLAASAPDSSAEERDKLWADSEHPFPFRWGNCWKHTVEYRVADFPAEVGFFVDVLGFDINVLDAGYAMFTHPEREFYISVIPVADGAEPTPPDVFSLQFKLENILDATTEIERRGVTFEQPLEHCGGPESLQHTAAFRTPAGIRIVLWGGVRR